MVEKRQRLLEAARWLPQSKDASAPLEPQPQGGQNLQEDLLNAEAEAAAVPSDLEAAITFLRDEMRVTCPQLPPLVCHTQLCSMLADRTSMERGLDDCWRRNVLRVFKLATGADEHGILLMRDYIDCILAAATGAGSPEAHMRGEQLQGHSEPSCCSSHAKEQQQEEQQEQQQRRQAARVQQQQQHAVARNFCVHVITQHPEVSISKARLRDLLMQCCNSFSPPGPRSQHQQGLQQQQQQQQQQQSCTGPLTPSELATLRDLDADKQISILLNLGVLSRHPSDDGAFLLGVPGMGPIIKAITAGRKELLRVVARKQYKEMPESQILGVSLPSSGKKRAASGARKDGKQGVQLRGSQLSTSFHLRDLLGKGWLQRTHSASGVMIRATKD